MIIFLYVLMMLVTFFVFSFIENYKNVVTDDTIPTGIVVSIFWPITVFIVLLFIAVKIPYGLAEDAADYCKRKYNQ